MSENELVVRQTSVPSQHEMMVYQTMAEHAVSSKMYRGIGEKAGVMMIMLSARELGIPPMQALNGGINIINGKAEISARMMSALIRRAGHQIQVKESSDDICVLIGKRADTAETQECSYSYEEAKKAGLVKPGGGWAKHPKDMCFARALSRLARQLFSDVIGIGYVEGEIKANDEVPLPEVVSEILEVDPAEEEEMMNKFLALFDHEEQFLAIEYLNAVMTHFGWSRLECLKKFLADKELLSKFEKWKEKRG